MREIKLETGVLEYIFKTCKPFLSKDDSRPILKYIKFEIEEKILRAIAANGYQMTVVTIEHKNENVERFECCIKPFTLPKKILDTTISVTAKETNITFKLADGNKINYTLQSVPVEAFINWRQVEPETSGDLSFNLNCNLLAQASSAMSITRGTYLKLSFKGDKERGINRSSPIKLETETPGLAKVMSIILPVRAVEEVSV